MQPLPSPDTPLISPSLKRHRSSTDQSRLPPQLTLPKPTPAPIRASLPTPPMSGTPPPESPLLPSEPHQVAGRRRKRSTTPPTTTEGTVTASAQFPTQGQYQPGLQARGGTTWVEPFSTAASSAAIYTQSGHLPPIQVPNSDLRYSESQTSPRTPRKAKAHVASACVNCKKKHLRCDSTRPCRRCVQSNKEDTCYDVEHKKRGRPPLKPEDSSVRRPFEGAFSPTTGGSAETSQSLPGGAPGSYAPYTAQRNLRPVPPYDPRAPLRPNAPYQPIYAQPTISPSAETAQGTFVPSRSPFQPGPLTGSSLQTPTMYSPQQSIPYAPSQPSYPGPLGYSQGQPQMISQQTSQPSYSNPIFPRIPGPGQNDLVTGMYGSTSLQLPPIRPTAEQNVLDPALVLPRSQGSQRRDDDPTREPDAKRPKMDIQGILGPRHD